MTKITRDDIKNSVDAVNVKPGLWNGDENSNVAILMDTENGETVWVRSRDWATYARMYGIDRVAFIIEAGQALWANDHVPFTRTFLTNGREYVYAYNVKDGTFNIAGTGEIDVTIVYNYGIGDAYLYRTQRSGRAAIEFVNDSHSRTIIAIY